MEFCPSFLGFFPVGHFPGKFYQLPLFSSPFDFMLVSPNDNSFPDVRTNCSLYWPRKNFRWLFCFIHYSKSTSGYEKANWWQLL
jgi:hypothetical protein